MQFKDKKFILLITFLILGFFVTVQIKSTTFINKQKTSTQKYIEQLKTQIINEKSLEKVLTDNLSNNEKIKENNLKTAVESKNDEFLKKQLEYLDEVRLKAGLTDVIGPGLTITLNDAIANINEDPRLIKYLIIHDSDIVRIMNELRKAGAQAISINNERIIATSAQVCAGPTIQVNKNRYAVPFEIKAIGDPELLYDSISKSEPIYYMLRDKIRVEFTKSKEIHISKYNNDLDSLISGLEEVEK